MQLLITRKGAVEIVEAPDPVPSEHEVLIQTAFSSISAGTELQALADQSRSPMSLARKGIRSWQKVKTSLSRCGWKQTMAKVSAALDKPLTMGYSVSGRVLQAGSAVSGFQPGDRVTGVGPWACHGTMVSVPRLFCARVSRHEMLRDASAAALACIGIHAMNRAELQDGSETVVFGLGCIGQLMAQVLRARGHRVIAFDPVESRRKDAMASGVEVFHPGEFDFEQGASRSTSGEGFDAVFLCAKAGSPELIRHAAMLCRKRGRLIVVGEFPIQISREIAYARELEVRFSAAYGEGRHDPAYERLGKDYPAESGRWTVERNLRLFVQWLEEGRLRPSHLHPRVELFSRAPAVYRNLAEKGTREAPVLTVLEYPENLVSKPVLKFHPRVHPSKNSAGLIMAGAGRFASEFHLPNLSRMADWFYPRILVEQSPARAAQAAAKFGFQQATCDWAEALRDPDSSAVLIATPHALHARQVISALEAGKHVLVEKPLCLHLEELDQIAKARRAAGRVLYVDFNRRQAPLSQKIFNQLEKNRAPVEIHYEFQAPPLPPGEWYDLPEEGGRFIGEVCHAVDWIAWLVGTGIERKTATPDGKGGADISLEFKDGSQALLQYRPILKLTGPKEKIKIQRENSSWQIEDFTVLRTYEKDALTDEYSSESKGHRETLEAFAAAIEQGDRGEDPFGFIASSRLVLELDQLLRK